MKTVVVGSDHGGYKTKQAVLKALAKDGFTVVDVGGFSEKKPDDYPDYAKDVAHTVAQHKDTVGVLVCGSGTGMVIAANKVKGVRAAVAYDTYSATMARKDNDANIIALRGRGIPQKDSVRFVRAFLRTPFTGAARHKRRLQKIARMEK